MGWSPCAAKVPVTVGSSDRRKSRRTSELPAVGSPDFGRDYRSYGDHSIPISSLLDVRLHLLVLFLKFHFVFFVVMDGGSPSRHQEKRSKKNQDCATIPRPSGRTKASYLRDDQGSSAAAPPPAPAPIGDVPMVDEEDEAMTEPPNLYKIKYDYPR